MLNWARELDLRSKTIERIATEEELRKWRVLQHAYALTHGGTLTELMYWEFLRWLLEKGKLDV